MRVGQEIRGLPPAQAVLWFWTKGTRKSMEGGLIKWTLCFGMGSLPCTEHKIYYLFLPR